MNTHVLFQTTRITKSFIAHITLVRSLVRVNTVALQMTRCVKCFHHITFARLLVRVNTHVLFQSIRVTKTLLAHITLVRFLVQVKTHVSCQTTRFTETLLAHITFIRFLLRVNTHVYSQFRCAHKHLLTNIALVLSSLSLRRFFVEQVVISFRIISSCCISTSPTTSSSLSSKINHPSKLSSR